MKRFKNKINVPVAMARFKVLKDEKYGMHEGDEIHQEGE